MTRYLSVPAIAKIYDRIGKWQDTQAFYEDPALDVLLRHGNFAEAKRIYEAGCGTGRVAARLLGDVMSENAFYVGTDVSERMIAIARERTESHRNALIVRADITKYDPGVVDRILSLFVVDLMQDAAIAQFLRRAHGSLVQGGLLCVAGLANGDRGAPRFISETWKRVHDVAPGLVGGCRPRAITPHLDSKHWRIVHVEHQTRFGISSEAVVAARR